MRAVAALIELGREHEAHFIKAAHGMPATLRPAFLPAALAGSYFKSAAKVGAGVLSETPDISVLRRHWTLLSRAMRGWG